MGTLIDQLHAHLKRDNRNPAQQLVLEAVLRLAAERWKSYAFQFVFARRMILSGSNSEAKKNGTHAM